MNQSAPIILVAAFLCALLASFYNFGGGPVAAGAPWYSGRLYIHLGWLSLCLFFAWLIWGHGRAY